MSEVQHRKRGRPPGTTQRDYPNAHRPSGTIKRDPEYQDFEDMQFADYVHRRIAQLAKQTGKTVSLESAIDDICKEFPRAQTGLKRYYRHGKRLLDECQALGISFAFSGELPVILTPERTSRSLARTLTNVRPDTAMSMITRMSMFKRLRSP